jgi:hypothetical protein
MSENIAPTININGTDGDELYIRYHELYQKTKELIDMMAKARPHGRDYQLKPETFQMARIQHDSMITELAKMHGWLMDILMQLQEQRLNGMDDIEDLKRFV